MKLITSDTVQTIRELESKNISHLHLDKKGNVWVSTSDGVFRVEITPEKPFEYSLKHLGIGNGY
jgi:ligand-binding sensor domain-containing protein